MEKIESIYNNGPLVKPVAPVKKIPPLKLKIEKDRIFEPKPETEEKEDEKSENLDIKI
jgi:hypothetical protein